MSDKIREMANDWDFSEEGRVRQSLRMKNYADFEISHGRIVVCDFVCPLAKTRRNFEPDIVIWMDTLKKGRFEDTNKIFERPTNVDFHIKEWNDENHLNIAKKIVSNV